MKNQPNILFIMSDDHAAHAISAYGSKINQTPFIDSLAKDGAILNRCFCTNNICEPSRAAILTGTYNHINKVTTIGAHLDNKLPNVAKELQKNNYQTAIFGKWHLGNEPQYFPSGFDQWKILQGQGPYFNPEMICNGEKKTFEGYTTDIITDLTIDYIQNRDKTKPFFVKYHHKAPHRHWDSDDKHKDMYKDTDIPLPYTFDDDYSNRSNAAKEAQMRITDHMCYIDIKCIPPHGKNKLDRVPHPKNLDDFELVLEENQQVITFSSQAELKNFKYQRYIKDYLRCVASIDDNLERVLEILKKEKIEENTIVIYTSDQGFFLGDHGWYDKRFMYEESLRMPFLVRYPREIKPNTVIDEMITNVDFAATFCDWAGIDKPKYMQGNSFAPLLRGEKIENWQESMYYRYWMHLAHHYVSAHYGIRTKTHKLIYYYGEALGQPDTIDESKPKEWELFDLVKDPYEMNSVYGTKEYEEIEKDLKEQLYSLQKKVGDAPFEEK